MSRLQNYWDARAALNFMLGGTGAGLMIALVFMQAPSAYAIALSLGLIAAGLGAVWLETGRKLRALHVLFNPFTSWMTRESFAALLLFPLGLGSIFVPEGLPFAAAAAAAFLYCQARILRAAKGIPAWRAPEIVALIAATGLAEGAGLCLLFTQEGLVLGLFALALIARAHARGFHAAPVQSDVFPGVLQRGAQALELQPLQALARQGLGLAVEVPGALAVMDPGLESRLQHCAHRKPLLSVCRAPAGAAG